MEDIKNLSSFHDDRKRMSFWLGAVLKIRGGLKGNYISVKFNSIFEIE